MKKFFGQFILQIVQDDLFMRVFCAIGALFFGGLGIALLVAAAAHGIDGRLPFQIFAWTFLIVSIGLGAVMALRIVLSIRSRLGNFLDRHMNSSLFSGWQDQSLLWILLPAIVLTLLLRRLGVRGQHASWCQQTSGTPDKGKAPNLARKE